MDDKNQVFFQKKLKRLCIVSDSAENNKVVTKRKEKKHGKELFKLTQQ